ncbi:MAG TPA: hypothetical protein VGM41_14495 [Chitinophagaceae bacterium]|jgi:hypothetical protein
MIFLKEHLTGHHYSWTGSANTLFTGDPSRRLFDRLNGDQVLFIINFFGQSVGKLTLFDGQKVEELILKELPENIKSEMAVFNWLREVYLYYWN